MQLSNKIKSMIKGWEGCRLTAYKCPAGVFTIGYGHTGKDVKAGMTITQAQADALFEADVNNFAQKVETRLKGVPVNNNQFDAITSLAYNIGLVALDKSTLLKKVKENPNNPSIRTEFAKFNHAGKVVLPGLTRRRAEEANHYFAS
jgi:lysozyme